MTFEAAIDDLIQHMEWADALIWKTVMASPAAASNDAVRDRLHHLHTHTARVFADLAGIGWRFDEREPVGCRRCVPGSVGRSFYESAMSDKSKLNEESLHRPVPNSLLKKAAERLPHAKSGHSNLEA